MVEAEGEGRATECAVAGFPSYTPRRRSSPPPKIGAHTGPYQASDDGKLFFSN